MNTGIGRETKKIFKGKLLFIMIVFGVFLGLLFHPDTAGSASAKTFKVLHIMSYNMDWSWNQDQFRGFQDALKGIDISYRLFEMDSKRQSDPEWIRTVSQEAKTLIENWQPDLVYANDDAAQEYIVKEYINSDIPFVFSGVNAHPKQYGFTGSKNVTGVLEQEHFVETVRLLKELVPGVTRIASIVDDSPMWQPVLTRMKQQHAQFPDITFIYWDAIETFQEFQEQVMAGQTTVDADLSKVEAGKLELEAEDINLRGLLENSVIIVQERAMKQGISLSIDIDSISETLEADERKLKQILYNLLSNAVKFTPKGGAIHLTAKCVPRTGLHIRESVHTVTRNSRSAPGAYIEISVNDTGIGLKHEDLTRIFEPFEQVENSASRKYQGTGLGLALTKRLVELHRGHIRAESEGEEQGSTFRVLLPVSGGSHI